MRYKIFILLLLSLSFVSCKKYLEIEPKNQRALSTVSDVRVVLAGYLKVLKPGEALNYHQTLGNVMYFEPSYWSLFEYYSDNIDFKQDYNKYIEAAGAIEGKNRAKLILINDFTIPTSIWVQHYRSIGFLNVLLDALEKAEGDERIKQQLKGEMLVCRALYYYKLLQYFSPYKEPENGIPVYTKVDEPFSGLAVARSSQKQVFDFIVTQLTEAVNFESTPDIDYNIFYNKTYIKNLLAQVYWYKAESGAKEATDYANAKKYAEQALVGIILPATYDDYINALNGTYTNNYPIYQRWGGSSSFNEQTYGLPWGSTAFTPHASPGLLSIFNADDYRYQAFIGADNSINRPLNTWPQDFTTAYNLFRPEEAYLINVEATYKSGSEPEARDLLNKFRKIRGVDAEFSGTDLQQEIINERRKEFCFQTDMRWLDMKRYGLGTSRTSLEMYGKTFNVEVQPNGYQYALPIPVDEELKLNRAMTPNPLWNDILF